MRFAGGYHLPLTIDGILELAGMIAAYMIGKSRRA
jgi:hypothetical protein